MENNLSVSIPCPVCKGVSYYCQTCGGHGKIPQVAVQPPVIATAGITQSQRIAESIRQEVTKDEG